jgi:general stress protein 26
MIAERMPGALASKARASLWPETIPQEVEAVLRNFRCAEMATMAKDGTPLAWPVVILYQPERGRFVATTSIALPQKAHNIRRNGRVSLLYSDPTASGLVAPPTVLVQGDATAPDEVVTWNDDLRNLWELLAVRQPASNANSANPFSRWLMDWYYMRLLIPIVPRRIRWWPEGDFTRPAQEIEVRHVG